MKVFTKRENEFYKTFAFNIGERLSLEFSIRKLMNTFKECSISILPTIDIGYDVWNDRRPRFCVCLDFVILQFWLCVWKKDLSELSDAE